MTKIIPAKDIARLIWEHMEEFANKYPEEQREELKALMLENLGGARIRGPVKEKNT